MEEGGGECVWCTGGRRATVGGSSTRRRRCAESSTRSHLAQNEACARKHTEGGQRPGCTRCTAAFELEAQSGLQVLHLHWECQSAPVHWIGLDPDAQPAPMHWTALDSDAQPAPMHWIGLDPDAQPAPMHWIGLDPDALQLLCNAVLFFILYACTLFSHGVA